VSFSVVVGIVINLISSFLSSLSSNFYRKFSDRLYQKNEAKKKEKLEFINHLINNPQERTEEYILVINERIDSVFNYLMGFFMFFMRSGYQEDNTLIQFSMLIVGVLCLVSGFKSNLSYQKRFLVLTEVKFEVLKQDISIKKI